MAAGPEPVAPLVLMGSDTGALQALHATALSDPSLPVAGVVVAGAAPTTDPDRAVEANDAASAWDDELAARTACPVHRKRLTDDASSPGAGSPTPYRTICVQTPIPRSPP
ncbi:MULTISPECIES: hypothetical protein [unclassified Streptomyces]|uniref:hypothetical protein n=1 Tax=unclassified Streptomyces TaxID=2593676 RepID=UPI002E81F460|nr:hypothetical protein [Streptomyces sp. NBC_00562]WUC25806.1 hypothetical protein OHA33_02550 [Streptomyces sp. NBC_00562]